MFGYAINQPELGGHPTTQQPSKFAVWAPFQQTSREYATTQQPAKSHVWRSVRPELLGRRLNQSLDGIQLPSSLLSLMFGYVSN